MDACVVTTCAMVILLRDFELYRMIIMTMFTVLILLVVDNKVP
jgi:hypothetical protein